MVPLQKDYGETNVSIVDGIFIPGSSIEGEEQQ